MDIKSMKAETGLFSRNPPNLVNSYIGIKDSIEYVCQSILELENSDKNQAFDDSGYKAKDAIDYQKKRWSKGYRNQDLALDQDQVLAILTRGFNIEIEQADKTNIIKTIKESLPYQSNSMVR